MAKILLVEDDYVLANTLIDWLEFKGHETTHIANGEEALNEITSSRANFDVVVLDWNIPGLSGIEVCSRYRKQGGSLPVLMLTGMHGSGEENQVKQAGANQYLAKPFQLEELTREVNQLLAVDA